MTAFQEVRILAGVQVMRSTTRFNIVLELSQRLLVQKLLRNKLI